MDAWGLKAPSEPPLVKLWEACGGSLVKLLLAELETDADGTLVVLPIPALSESGVGTVEGLTDGDEMLDSKPGSAEP